MKALCNKLNAVSWISWTIDYFKNETAMACITLGVFAFIILTVVLLIRAAVKNKKAKGSATPVQTPVEQGKTPAPAAKKKEITPTQEKRDELALTAEEESEVASIFDNATAKSSVRAKQAKKEEESEHDKEAKYKGKWQICRVITDAEDEEEMFFFELRASNGELLLSSEEYTSYQGALRGIQTHKINIANGNFKITLSKKGDYIFKLLSGKNTLLCMGQNYPTKTRCESAMESTARFAKTAIVDENVQDIVVKVPKEEDTPLPPLPDGYNGKWIISSKFSEEGDKIFYFELFANNGEKLLSSEEYTTYIGAVNGIQTHKKNIEKNNFRISLTKRGDYIYKLLNGNGQLLCLGEHYKNKRLCQNAVDSVQRFAISAPVLTEERK